MTWLWQIGREVGETVCCTLSCVVIMLQELNLKSYMIMGSLLEIIQFSREIIPGRMIIVFVKGISFPNLLFHIFFS